MKKILGIIMIIAALVCFGFAIYNYVNIQMVVSVEDGKTYDGFEEEYVNGKPNSSHTVFMYGSAIGGVALASGGYSLIKKEE